MLPGPFYCPSSVSGTESARTPRIILGDTDGERGCLCIFLHPVVCVLSLLLLIVTSPSAPRVFLPASQMKAASTFIAMCVWVLQTVFSCRKRYVQDSVGLDCTVCMADGSRHSYDHVDLA